MNKFLKYLLWLLVGIGLAIAISWLSFLYLPKASSEGKTADIAITATQLFQQFEQDETTSNATYISKVLEVRGLLREKSTDENGSTVLILAAGDEFGGVLCTLEESQTEKAMNLQFGKSVTVKGVCTGMLMEVVLNKGVIVD